MDKETSYESFVIKINQQYNNEVDMYGDIRRAGECNLKVNHFIPDILMYIYDRYLNLEYPFHGTY